MYLGDFYLMVKKDPVAAFGEYAISQNLFRRTIKGGAGSSSICGSGRPAQYRMGVVVNQLKAVPLVFGMAPVAAIADRADPQSVRLRGELAVITAPTPRGRSSRLSPARLGEGDEAERLYS